MNIVATYNGREVMRVDYKDSPDSGWDGWRRMCALVHHFLPKAHYVDPSPGGIRYPEAVCEIFVICDWPCEQCHP